MATYYKYSLKAALTRNLAVIFTFAEFVLFCSIAASFVVVYYFQKNYAAERLTDLELDRIKGELFAKAGEISPYIQIHINDLRLSTIFFNEFESGNLLP